MDEKTIKCGALQAEEGIKQGRQSGIESRLIFA
jgi:hypothetical protein